jgi:hypothetical protein
MKVIPIFSKPKTGMPFEPAGIIFPLPADLKDQYLKWAQAFQESWGNVRSKGGEEGQNFIPIFIPVYSSYQGLTPFPSFCPPAPPCGGAATGNSGLNPFIIFLIFILILLGTRKEPILNALRNLLLKNDDSKKVINVY